MSTVFDIGLCALVLAVAVWIVSARDAFAAVITFVIFGLLLALVWVRLAAVDVALTEAAIGSGVTGALLIGAAARLRTATVAGNAAGVPLRIAAGVLCGAVSVGLALLVLAPANPAPTLAPVAMAHLAESGLGNPVAGVLFVYRALDTLLEKVVLLLALIGVWSLAPDRMWGGAPALARPAAPNDTLVFLAQVLPPIGIVVGIYMFWTGTNHPGGAFQGGAVLAAVWMLVLFSGLRAPPAIANTTMRGLLVLGPLVFIVIGFAGWLAADAFLAYPPGYAKPLIVAVEATLTLSIGVTLGLLALGPPERA